MGDPPPRGDPFGHKTPNFWDIKLQIFGAEGAENFEKMKDFKEKLALFGDLRENFAKFGSTYRFRTNLCTKITVFSILKIFQKFCWKFREILRNFRKFLGT